MEKPRTEMTPRRMRLLRRGVLGTVVFAFWLLVAWPLSPLDGSVLWGDVAAGLACAVFVALVMRELVSTRFERLLNPSRYLAAGTFVPVFLWHVMRSNLDVAYRVLHPSMPIRPGIVRARTRLGSTAARTLLANSITLTPGTLTLDLVGDQLYIHCIHIPPGDEEAFAASIVARFEGLIAGILE